MVKHTYGKSDIDSNTTLFYAAFQIVRVSHVRLSSMMAHEHYSAHVSYSAPTISSSGHAGIESFEKCGACRAYSGKSIPPTADSCSCTNLMNDSRLAVRLSFAEVMPS